ATHSTAVKLHAYSRANFDAAAVDFDAEHLAPLYRLRPHTIGQSYGLAVARRLGLPEEIIAAAEASMGAGSAELSDPLQPLETERAQLRDELARLREREQSLAEQERRARAATERAREVGDAERKRLREETSAVVEEFRREGNELLREMKTQTRSRADLTAFAT